MKKTIFASLLLVVMVVATACSFVQPTETPTPVLPTPTEVVDTPEPTLEPTEVVSTEEPTATPYPAKWRYAYMIRDSYEYECTEKYNDSGNCIFDTVRPENKHRIWEGEMFWCDWPIQADGGKVCEIMTGSHAGTFANRRHLEWIDPPTE